MGIIKEPNYTQYPNVILDNADKFEHPEFKIISVIIRMTFGYHKEKAKISLTQLMNKTGMAKTTIIRATDKLEAKGIIKRTVKSSGTEWEIIVEVVAERYHSQSDSGSGAIPLDDKSGSGAIPPTYTRDLLKKKDIKKEGTEEEDFSFLPDSLTTEEFKEIWKEWEKHRKEIRHKLTPSTRKRQIEKLSSVPIGIAIYTIENSIENGWQGLFIPKASDPIWQEVEQEELEDDDPWALYKQALPEKFK